MSDKWENKVVVDSTDKELAFKIQNHFYPLKYVDLFTTTCSYKWQIIPF